MRNRKFIFTALVALIAMTFTSCIEDPEPAALDALTDVFVQKKVQDGEEKYGLSFWVYANKSIQSVIVDGPDDESWTLEKDQNSNLVYTLYPDMEQYTDSMPQPGNYTFTITSTQNGEAPLTSIDKLEDKELAAVTIDSTQFVSSKLKTTWTKVNDASAYIVRLYDTSDKLIFQGTTLASSKTDFSFGITDSGWANTNAKAEDGKTYRLELLALLYETASTSANRDYNIQFISSASTEIVWGE